MTEPLLCPHCQGVVSRYRQPSLAADLIIETPDQGFVLIERKNPPHGWALPGGFVDYGETLEQAAEREAREETGLKVDLIGQFKAYSDPGRDPRGHTISVVFLARADGQPQGADDAARAGIFTRDNLPPLAFDHRLILDEYFAWKDKKQQAALSLKQEDGREGVR